MGTSPDVERRFAPILVADAKGYSRLMGDTPGDNLLAEFAEVYLACKSRGRLSLRKTMCTR